MSYENEDMVKFSALDFFTTTQETLEDAKRKKAAESATKTAFLRMTKDGTYSVRVLPLAPEIGPDGAPLPMKRKGYEYPYKDIFLKLNVTDKTGKRTVKNYPVCHTKLAYPSLDNDLIELYVRLACEVNANDKAFCDKITGSSFNGGLKYNNTRCMYVLDNAERSKGLQILQLSYSQYKDLDDLRLTNWTKMQQKNPSALCPISSPLAAYPVEIRRETGQKTEYKISISVIDGTDTLSQEELQALLDAPRLPEALYVYRRFHLDVTIEFLKQRDEEYGLQIMNRQEIKDCIDQIKLHLPADDTSRFIPGGDDAPKVEAMTLEKLWDMFDDLEEKGLGDRSEEGQQLRTALREFIEDNNLDVYVDRKKSNQSVLEEIADLMNEGAAASKPAPQDSVELDEPVNVELDTDEVDEPSARRRERNDDTNEPAIRRTRPDRVRRS